MSIFYVGVINSGSEGFSEPVFTTESGREADAWISGAAASGGQQIKIFKCNTISGEITEREAA